jgi:hypothetical protein
MSSANAADTLRSTRSSAYTSAVFSETPSPLRTGGLWAR